MVFDSFLDYEKGGKHENKDLTKDNPSIFNPRIVQDAYASPRSMHAASDILDVMDKLDAETLQKALEGTVGRPFASILHSYIRFGQQVPPINTILSDPNTAPIPNNKIAQQVQVFQFITRTETREHAEAFTKYVKRLQPEMQALFLRRITESDRIGPFSSVNEFGEMLTNNRIYYRVQ